MWLGILTCIGPGAIGAAAQQRDSVILLFPGSEFHVNDLPADPGGEWWVLHGPADGTRLTARTIAIAAVPGCNDEPGDAPRGRTVSVPGVSDAVLLVRGAAALTAGPIRTAFLDDGIAGEAETVEIDWDATPLVVRHVTDGPSGDQPGRYRIELTLGDRHVVLHEDQWQGEGQWRLRWVGDLNRDGLPDLLADASYKYSVYTTRLFLSGDAGVESVGQVATLTASAC